MLKSCKKIFFIAVILLLVLLLVVAVYKPQWLYSLIAATFSYILTMAASMYSIGKKISQKITQAQHDIEQESIEFPDNSTAYREKLHPKKQHYKKMLTFLNISKVSLGFELSFSWIRILAFIIMLLGFALLIYYQVFYPIAYILGIALGVIIVVGYLFCNANN
ncbi:hypothetical protein CQA66_01995 [Helicobacter aurati]|uniref:Uncharacterized protein n=1 Tax=Helicobacter aurati TaxID=137778 RepID=A0A3D8J8L9_9HELI|nr:OPT/YSL family transporter [Helicobacter aurati]RDU73456.1 hypothetical protein CQA66_01995 [Helicobacter aurati]